MTLMTVCVCIRSLCRNSKERCESVLGIVGLQWPEDTDCAQFPEEGQANSSCLLPDPDVNGPCTDTRKLKQLSCFHLFGLNVFSSST